MQLDCSVDQSFYVIGCERISGYSILFLGGQALEFFQSKAAFLIDVIPPRVLTAPYERGLLPLSVKAEEFGVVLKNRLPVPRSGFVGLNPVGPAFKCER